MHLCIYGHSQQHDIPYVKRIASKSTPRNMTVNYDDIRDIFLSYLKMPYLEGGFSSYDRLITIVDCRILIYL